MPLGVIQKPRSHFGSSLLVVRSFVLGLFPCVRRCVMDPLSRQLLRLYGLGQLSAVDVQTLAAAALVRDGGRFVSTVATRLAHAGSSGRNPNNMNRDVMLIALQFAVSTSSAKPYVLKLQDGTSMDMYLPHEVYPALVKSRPGATWTLGDRAETDPLGAVLQRWAAHADVQIVDITDVAALGVHYDGVQYNATHRAGAGKSVQVISMNVLSASTEGDRQHRLPLAVLRKSRFCGCGCGGFHTMQLIFEVVAWSMRALRDGVSPDCRHDGSPFGSYDLMCRTLAGQQLPKAGLVQVRGDWEALVQFFMLRSYSSENFCWQCNCTASPGPLCFSDFGPAAPHRATKLSHSDYLLACAAEGGQPCHLFRCPGFDLGFLVVDSMHAADLGCFADAMGSLFWLELVNKQWSQNQAEGLKTLNRKLGQWYARPINKGLSKIGVVGQPQIIANNPGYPYLKGKAAQVRHLAEFGLMLANEHLHGVHGEGGRPAFRFPRSHRLHGRHDEHLGLLVRMFTGMCGYCRSLAAPDFDETACRESMMTFLQSLGSLNSLWRAGLPEAAAKAAPFHVRRKAHMLQQLVQDHGPVLGSPAKFRCYRDEDFVGSVKSVCAKTKHPWTLETRVLQKIRILEGLGIYV